jgi:hypothetical protein
MNTNAEWMDTIRPINIILSIIFFFTKKYSARKKNNGRKIIKWKSKKIGLSVSGDRRNARAITNDIILISLVSDLPL